MLSRCKSILSAFLLLLFIFPLVEKEVHTLRHVEAFHCKATDKHFHEIQHACAICDFIVPVTTAPSKPDHDLNVYTSSSLILFYSETKVVSVTEYFPSLRAPPVC